MSPVSSPHRLSFSIFVDYPDRPPGKVMKRGSFLPCECTFTLFTTKDDENYFWLHLLADNLEAERPSTTLRWFYIEFSPAAKGIGGVRVTLRTGQDGFGVSAVDRLTGERASVRLAPLDGDPRLEDRAFVQWEELGIERLA